MTSEPLGPAASTPLPADAYVRAFQASPNLMALSEVDTGRYVEVNEAFLGALGYQRAEVIGRTALELGIFAEPEQHAVVLGRPPAAGRLRDYAVRVRTKAGEVRASLFAAEPLQVGGQRLLLTIMSDITERHRTELERQAAAELYHSLLASLDSVVAVFDAAGQALYLNEVAARQLGGTPADFVGRRMSDLFPEPSASRQLADLQAVLAADQGRVAESEAVVQGRPRWYRTHLQPIHDAQGRAVQVLINTADITEFRAAQSELEQLNETLEQRVAHRTAEVQDLYENAPCGYHSLDAAGVIVRINQTELDWLGYTRAEVVGRLNFSHLLTPAGRAAFAETYPRLQQAGAIRDLEFELVRRDGSLLPVSLSATAIYDAQGRYLMDRAVLTDITAQRQAEAERRRRHEELSAANHALARAARLKNEFLSTMSHELRTPLNAILSLSESLEEGVYGPLNPAQVRALSHVAESGRHLLDLINDILDLSKIEAGKLEWVGGPVDVAELCQAALRLVRQLAAQKPLSLTFTQDSAVTILTGDARRLKQMLVNLLSNAVKFTPAGGEVGLEVQGAADGQTVRFTVWDTGIGIAAEHMGRLFQPFTQIDSSLARQYAGTGLGLALVRRLAELHGGGVAVESAPGRGSRFSLTLPWREPPEAGPLEPLLAGRTFLVVEDNPVNQRSLGDMLRARGGQVVVAGDGSQALELAVALRPDLILMDILLPELDGLEVTRRLRARPEFARTPILVVTALALPGDQERCRAAGATAYLTKPFASRALLLALEHALTP